MRTKLCPMDLAIKKLVVSGKERTVMIVEEKRHMGSQPNFRGLNEAAAVNINYAVSSVLL